MESSFIHVDEAVATAMTLLPQDSSLDKTVARHWAYMGLKDIGPGDHWFSECTLYPSSNLSMKKPDDMYRAIDIALFSGQQELRYSYKGLGHRIHSSGNNLIDTGEYAPAGGAPIDLSEDSYYFHLGSNGGGVTSAVVKYWKLPVDVDGLPMIPETQALAIAMFIRWMWTIKKNDNQSDRGASRAEYIQARNEARSATKMPNGIAFEQAAKEWNSMFSTTPQFKRF